MTHETDLKQPASPSTAAAQALSPDEPMEERTIDRSSSDDAQGSAAADGGRGSADTGGETELRKDSMMARLLDALAAGEDVGHYGRLVFAMIARHFLPHEQVLGYLVNDRDFSEEQATAMLRQVDSRDYNPPKRERLLEWQREQDFQFMDPDDPDSGNVYRNLKFPDAIYKHIEHYQEAKTEAA